MRPFDRDDLLASLESRLRTGRERHETDAPLVVAATQSIEAGADYDFDALITECASYDALKQRFGRVDRDGQLSELGNHSKSLVLSTAENVTPTADDAIYGSALAKTWAWMPEREFDFAHLVPASHQISAMVATRPKAPKLLPSHLDRWVQTSPQPDASPDIGLWLHGLTADRAIDVNLVWRADLTESLLAAGREPEAAEQLTSATTLATNLVTACRPGSAEAMSVPIQAVRNWLAGLASRDGLSLQIPVADVEGAPPPDKDDSVPSNAEIRPVLRWSGDDSRIARQAGDIRPGDTLIVPVTYGGISARNWDPAGREPVSDLGHRVQAEQRVRAVLRLSQNVLAAELEALPSLPLPADADETGRDDKTVVSEWLKEADLALDGKGSTGQLVRRLREDGRRAVDRVFVSLVNDSMYVISSKRPVKLLTTSQRERAMPEEPPGGTADSEPGTSSFTGVKIPLDDHLSRVQRWATALADACGLPGHLAGDLGLAARLHDVGKADPRFQLMLHQGRLSDGEMLAKSAILASERAERERARWESGYPSGGRHELLSVAMVQDHADLAARANDWDLVLHLIASHHGYCRPFAPVAHDTHPVMAEFCHDGFDLRHSTATGLARIDSGIADRFWTLVRRYGWFGLAQLESILRLADHRASAAEQIAPSNDQTMETK
jgi:CRISPR-associated endonuclease/helicase Cas3